MRFLCAILLALVACPAWAAQDGGSKPLEHIVLQLKWRHQFQFAGYYAAVAEGFYRDAGLEVELVEAKQGEDPAPVVASGMATYGVGGSDLVLARAKGLPVVALAAIYQHSPYAIVTLSGRGIDSVHDLVGKRMMIEPQAAELLAYLRYEGIDIERIEQVPHSFDIESLARGEVDATTAYVTDEVFALEEAGLDYQVFTARSAGIDFYGDVLFTTEDELARHPERVSAFLKATIKGWHYALDHPQEIARLIRARYSTRHSLRHLLFEAAQTRRLMAADVVEIGYMHEGRWRHIADTYASLGMMPPDFELAGFLYQPDARVDHRGLYRTVAALAAALVLAGALGTWFWALSRRLRREIGEREAAQWQTEAVLARERNLLSILAHDFATPLNVISVAAQLLERFLSSGDGEKARREVDRIQAATAMLTEQIAACLGQNREHRDKPSAIGPIALRPMLAGLLKERRALVPERSFQLEVEESAEPDVVISADEVLISAVFANLLDNAIKYSVPRGAIRVRLAKAEGSVRVTVLDDGPGIAAEEAEKIFEKYQRAAKAPKAGGIGLGLFMVRSVVEAHGGSVRAVPGAQGEFVVTLPLAPEPGGPPA
ncbi:Histidine kinase-, DNA gyrase B-, and HSP90-like ATPase [Tistlia consotensis]|uniref:histidine kinase n=1 Tax=Tistlia consotensis USBA 355 TaxID=560819 RepID=A0A1Y6B5V4_9PROT|nr:ABC transporter substrate-binding protein [Tistlia consotensis]SME89397.1 Histidine kinase-, DNA gyrase B-, and HSP90-like ATPase [Tistlia consotensis USBA 355]SNR25944.1 Histidine kinase-, DNA gyrase B-, and HSP90-like ATPase [Tistlia consotensis]